MSIFWVGLSLFLYSIKFWCDIWKPFIDSNLTNYLFLQTFRYSGYIHSNWIIIIQLVSLSYNWFRKYLHYNRRSCCLVGICWSKVEHSFGTHPKCTNARGSSLKLMFEGSKNKHFNMCLTHNHLARWPIYLSVLLVSMHNRSTYAQPIFTNRVSKCLKIFCPYTDLYTSLVFSFFF